MANLTDRINEMETILEPAKGNDVALLKVPVRLLTIDERYQRKIDDAKTELSYLLSSWDERKLLPLIVIPHKEEGLFYILDGNGRLTASQLIDKEKYKYLTCMVILSEFENEEERLKYEAKEFAFQAQGNRKVTAVLRHGAHECLKTPAVMILDKYKDIYHYEYKTKGGRGQTNAGVLGSYTEAFNICKDKKGEETWKFIMEVCDEAGFGRKTNGYSCAVLRSLRDLHKYYPDNLPEITECLGNELRKTDPLHLKSSAVHEYPLLDYKVAMSIMFEDIICDKLGLKHKRKAIGKTVVKTQAA